MPQDPSFLFDSSTTPLSPNHHHHHQDDDSSTSNNNKNLVLLPLDETNSLESDSQTASSSSPEGGGGTKLGQAHLRETVVDVFLVPGNKNSDHHNPSVISLSGLCLSLIDEAKKSVAIQKQRLETVEGIVKELVELKELQHGEEEEAMEVVGTLVLALLHMPCVDSECARITNASILKLGFVLFGHLGKNVKGIKGKGLEAVVGLTNPLSPFYALYGRRVSRKRQSDDELDEGRVALVKIGEDVMTERENGIWSVARVVDVSPTDTELLVEFRDTSEIRWICREVGMFRSLTTTTSTNGSMGDDVDSVEDLLERWRIELEPGALCDAFRLEDGLWYEACVVDAVGNHLRITYIGFPATKDAEIERTSPNMLARFHSKSLGRRGPSRFSYSLVSSDPDEADLAAVADRNHHIDQKRFYASLPTSSQFLVDNAEAWFQTMLSGTLEALTRPNRGGLAQLASIFGNLASIMEWNFARELAPQFAQALRVAVARLTADEIRRLTPEAVDGVVRAGWRVVRRASSRSSAFRHAEALRSDFIDKRLCSVSLDQRLFGLKALLDLYRESREPHRTGMAYIVATNDYERVPVAPESRGNALVHEATSKSWFAGFFQGERAHIELMRRAIPFCRILLSERAFFETDVDAVWSALIAGGLASDPETDEARAVLVEISRLDESIRGSVLHRAAMHLRAHAPGTTNPAVWTLLRDLACQNSSALSGSATGLLWESAMLHPEAGAALERALAQGGLPDDVKLGVMIGCCMSNNGNSSGLSPASMRILTAALSSHSNVVAQQGEEEAVNNNEENNRPQTRQETIAWLCNETGLIGSLEACALKALDGKTLETCLEFLSFLCVNSIGIAQVEAAMSMENIQLLWTQFASCVPIGATPSPSVTGSDVEMRETLLLWLAKSCRGVGGSLSSTTKFIGTRLSLDALLFLHSRFSLESCPGMQMTEYRLFLASFMAVNVLEGRLRYSTEGDTSLGYRVVDPDLRGWNIVWGCALESVRVEVAEAASGLIPAFQQKILVTEVLTPKIIRRANLARCRERIVEAVANKAFGVVARCARVACMIIRDVESESSQRLLHAFEATQGDMNFNAQMAALTLVWNRIAPHSVTSQKHASLRNFIVADRFLGGPSLVLNLRATDSIAALRCSIAHSLRATSPRGLRLFSGDAELFLQRDARAVGVVFPSSSSSSSYSATTTTTTNAPLNQDNESTIDSDSFNEQLQQCLVTVFPSSSFVPLSSVSSSLDDVMREDKEDEMAWSDLIDTCLLALHELRSMSENQVQSGAAFAVNALWTSLETFPTSRRIRDVILSASCDWIKRVGEDANWDNALYGARIVSFLVNSITTNDSDLSEWLHAFSGNGGPESLVQLLRRVSQIADNGVVWNELVRVLTHLCATLNIPESAIPQLVASDLDIARLEGADPETRAAALRMWSSFLRRSLSLPLTLELSDIHALLDASTTHATTRIAFSEFLGLALDPMAQRNVLLFLCEKLANDSVWRHSHLYAFDLARKLISSEPRPLVPIVSSAVLDGFLRHDYLFAAPPREKNGAEEEDNFNGGYECTEKWLKLCTTTLCYCQAGSINDHASALIDMLFVRVALGTHASTVAKRSALSGTYTICSRCPAARMYVAQALNNIPRVSVLRSSSLDYGKTFDPCGDRRECDFAGLVNLGSTCFLNALVQQLFMIPSVCEFFLRLPSAASDNTSTLDSTTRLVELFRSVVTHLRFTTRKSFTLAPFFDGLVECTASANQQQDVHEFFNMTCDRLDDALVATQTDPLTKRRLFAETLGVEYCNTWTRLDVDASSSDVIGDVTRRAPGVVEYICFVDVPQEGGTLEDGLRALTKGTIMRDYRWLEGGPPVKTLKRQSFGRLGDVLPILLKRFRFNHETFVTEKISARLEFPLELDMYPFTDEGIAGTFRQDRDRDEYYKYILVGVVIHSGETSLGGHYFAHIRTRFDGFSGSGNASVVRRGDWITLNDELVTTFDVSLLPEQAFGGPHRRTIYRPDLRRTLDVEVPATQSAYMLVYQRVSSLSKHSVESIPIDPVVASENAAREVARILFDPPLAEFVARATEFPEIALVAANRFVVGPEAVFTNGPWAFHALHARASEALKVTLNEGIDESIQVAKQLLASDETFALMVTCTEPSVRQSIAELLAQASIIARESIVSRVLDVDRGVLFTASSLAQQQQNSCWFLLRLLVEYDREELRRAATQFNVVNESLAAALSTTGLFVTEDASTGRRVPASFVASSSFMITSATRDDMIKHMVRPPVAEDAVRVAVAGALLFQEGMDVDVPPLEAWAWAVGVVDSIEAREALCTFLGTNHPPEILASALLDAILKNPTEAVPRFFRSIGVLSDLSGPTFVLSFFVGDNGLLHALVCGARSLPFSLVCLTQLTELVRLRESVRIPMAQEQARWVGPIESFLNGNSARLGSHVLGKFKDHFKRLVDGVDLSYSSSFSLSRNNSAPEDDDPFEYMSKRVSVPTTNERGGGYIPVPEVDSDTNDENDDLYATPGFDVMKSSGSSSNSDAGSLVVGTADDDNAEEEEEFQQDDLDDNNNNHKSQ